jgi:hypothetical protein
MKAKIHRTLSRLPSVFTFGLIWQSLAPDVAEIVQVMQLIDTKIAMRKLFPELESKGVYVLRGVVCYYAQHYVAFVKNPDTKEWIMFDDETVKRVQKLYIDNLLPKGWIMERRDGQVPKGSFSAFHVVLRTYQMKRQIVAFLP